MKKWILLILILSLACSRASALTRMGPPVATLEQGKYAFTPELTISKNYIDRTTSLTDSDININTLLARISYGLREDVELFARCGMVSGCMMVPLTVGGGAKWTFLKNERFPLGVLYQIHWSPGQDFSEDYDLLETQIAVGTMYRFEQFSLFGGPFMHLLSGDEDIDIRRIRKADNEVDEESKFGAYAGVRRDLTEKICLDIELQLTGSAFGIAVGLPWRF